MKKGGCHYRLSRIAVLSALVCILTPAAAALDPQQLITQYSHRNWQTRTGLPQNSVQSIAQTPDGYLWLGTQEGLARFDGVRVRMLNTGQKPANKRDTTMSLTTSQAGSLWSC